MKTIKFLKLIGGVGFLLMTVLALFGVVDAFSATAPGVVLGLAAGAGVTEHATPTTSTAAAAASELLEQTLSQKITEINVSRYPLDTLMRKVGVTVTAPSWKYEWYNVDEKGFVDTLAAGFDTSASSTYDSANAEHTLTVTNIHYWNVDDVGWFPEYASANGNKLVVHVVAINRTSSTLTVIVVNEAVSGTSDDMVDVSNGATLVNIGVAKSELDASTTPHAIYPAKSYNYNQIHMAQFEESLYHAIHKKEINWGANDFRVQTLDEMRKKAELTAWFGERGYKYDPEGQDYKYFSGGITTYLDQSVSYTAGAVTNKTMLGWCESFFTGNSGSDERYAFIGKALMTDLGKADELVQKALANGNVTVKHGLRFAVIESNFGVVYLKHAPLFDQVGWSAKGAVMDISKLERSVMKKLEVTPLELDKSGTRRAKVWRLDEAWCLATRYPDVHHLIAPA